MQVIDATTDKPLSRINTQIKLRCHETLSGAVESFTFTGGSLRTQWFVVDKTSQPTFGGKLIGSAQVVSLSSNNNVLQASNGGGIILAFRTLQESTIDNALTSSDLNYLVEIDQIITATLNFQFQSPGSPSASQTKTVHLVSTVGSTQVQSFFRIVNENPEPPTPTNNFVNIISLNTLPNPMFSDDPSPQFRVSIRLPEYQSDPAENFPTIDVFKPIDNSANVQLILSNVPVTLRSGTDTFIATIDIRSGDLLTGQYVVKAKHDTRTNTDTQIFAVFEPDTTPNTEVETCEGLSQTACQTLIDEQEDPCVGLTGNQLDVCNGVVEQFAGCNSGFTSTTKTQVDIIVTSGLLSSIFLQPGFTLQDDPICVSTESIAEYNVKLAQQEPDTEQEPGMDTTGVGDTLTATIISGLETTSDVAENIKPVIIYQIVYDGDDEIGIIEEEDFVIDFSALEFAGTVEAKTYELARIIVTPALDVTDVTGNIQVSNSDPDWTYIWTGEITKLNGAKNDAVLETCSGTCTILDMSFVGVQVQSNQIGVQAGFGDENVEKTYYQIARSDIQPNDLYRCTDRNGNCLLESGTAAFNRAFPNTFLEEGDQLKLKLEVTGGFKPTITVGGETTRVQASITPMTWEHTFIWLPQFGANFEPCADLSGQDQLNCLGNPIGKSEACKDLTANQCKLIIPSLDADGCTRETLPDGSSIKLCYGAAEEEEEDLGNDASGGFGSESNGSETSGEPGVAGTCPEGTTATECSDIILKIIEQRLAGILGIGGSTITAISNNAILIIGSIIAILVIAIIARIALRKKRL